jgi:hypothetical protein
MKNKDDLITLIETNKISSIEAEHIYNALVNDFGLDGIGELIADASRRQKEAIQQGIAREKRWMENK